MSRGRFTLPPALLDTFCINICRAWDNAAVVARADPTWNIGDVDRQITAGVRQVLLDGGCPPDQVDAVVANVISAARHRRSLESMEALGRA